MQRDATRNLRSNNWEIGQKRFSVETAGRKYLLFVNPGGTNYLRVNTRKSASTIVLFIG